MANHAPRKAQLASTALLLVCAQASTCSSWALQSGEQPNSPIELPGKPIPPDYSKLSEHNIEWLKTQPAEVQMEFLLGAAINHDHGATDMIAKLVEAGMASCIAPSVGRIWRPLRSTQTICACELPQLRSISQRTIWPKLKIPQRN